jgi:lipoprotein-releasing system permease protein
LSAVRRQLALLDHALGSLRRRLGRGITLALGLAFAVGLYASVLFLTDALRQEFAAGARTLPDLTVQRMMAGRPALLDVAFAAKIAELPAVASARPRVWGYLFLPALSGNMTVIGASDRRGLARTIGKGRAPKAGPGEAVLGAALADYLGIEPGDEIELPGDDHPCVLQVVGTFHSDSALATADVLYTSSDDDARCLLGVPPGQATDIAVRLTNPDEASILSGKIAGLLPHARVLDKSLVRRTYELSFDGRAGLLAVGLLPALAALLLLAWDRLTGVGELERREIGLLKAIGWETADVLAARMWESVIVSITGAVVGLAGAYAYCFVLGAPGLAPILFGWSSIHPPIDLVPAVDLEQILAILSAVVVPFAAVSVVPAWRAAMMDPDRAMRGAP